ncbi:MAG: hypothetical protein ACTHNG_16445 [Ginsengibacter sp.]
MKSLMLLFFLSATSAASFAQTDSTATADSNNKSTLTLAAIYANNASYYGQKAAEPTPYVAAAAVFQLPSGIYFTGQSYKLLNDTSSAVSAGALGLGYTFHIGKKFITDMSYSHSFYPAYSPLLQASNAENASLSFSIDSVWIKPKLTADYAFGKTNDAFVTAEISKSIDLFSISSKDIVTIEPAANVVGGTQHFYQSYITEKKIHDSVLGILGVPGLGNSRSVSHADTVTTTSFNLLSYNFKLPIAYNRSHYLLQAEYQLSVLGEKAVNKQINSFLTFSFYYQF